MSEFKYPDFLLNHSTNEVHQKMKDILPHDLDVSEGSHSWNFTRPTALVVAEVCEFILPEVIKLIFPSFSYSEFLDYHAETRNMARLNPTAAIGEITITGKPGSVIPTGSMFSTTSINGMPSVDYVTLEEAIIDENGIAQPSEFVAAKGIYEEKIGHTVTWDEFAETLPDKEKIKIGKVRIQCTKTGIVGNATKHTIIHKSSHLTGVTGVTNEKEVTGGTEREDDISLQNRITEYDRTQGQSFVGNIADYKRWATSVDGVGAAIIIPANDDTGLVTIILVDANGAPATEDLCEEVYNYIMRPDDEDKRLAPVNAYLSVIPPETLTLCVRATTELELEATMESVQANLMAQLALYIPESIEDNEIKYTRVGAILSSIPGVNDYSDLEIGLKQEDGTISFGHKNIPITSRQLPIIEVENLILTAGTV